MHFVLAPHSKYFRKFSFPLLMLNALQNDPSSEDPLDSDFSPHEVQNGGIWDEEAACCSKFDLKFEEV